MFSESAAAVIVGANGTGLASRNAEPLQSRWAAFGFLSGRLLFLSGDNGRWLLIAGGKMEASSGQGRVSILSPLTFDLSRGSETRGWAGS